MESLPPKNLRTQLVRLDHNLKQIERGQFAGIQRAPGALPVLEAFQEFLDNERKKARRRMLALTALFVVLVLAAGGAGTALVYWQVNRLALDFDGVSAKTDGLAAAVSAAREASHATLSELESRLGTNTQHLVERQDSLLSAQAAIETRVGEEGSRIASIQDVLDRLVTENKAIKEDLDRVMKEWPSAASQVRALATLKADTRAPNAPQQPTPEARVAMPAVPAGSAADTMATMPVALTIVPPGAETGIRWRLPITPE